MKRLFAVGCLALSLVCCRASGTQSHETRAKEEAGLKYPVARKDDTTDDFGGNRVADPYRWMESLDSKDVADWVKAANAVTEPYLASLPLRDHFNKRLTELWNYP